MREKPEILVGSVPQRISAALSIRRGGEIRVLAYFVSDEAADEFLAAAEDRSLVRHETVTDA